MGASYVAGSPLMRLVAVAFVLLAVLLFSLSYPFLTAMRAAFPDESELLPILAIISAAVTMASFLAGPLLANRLFVRFGVATVALALPLVYLAGFGLWLVRFGTATAIAVRVAQQVTQRGVSNAAWSALFNVVPSRLRGQVLAFMDGVPGQLGTMLSGVLLILASSLALEQVFVLGLITALACLGVGVLIRRTYASSLVATLREGQAEQVLEGGPGLRAMASDPRVVAELREETRSPDARRRLLATNLLTRLESQEALTDLQLLCTDDDSRVRRAAIEGLARLDPRGAGPWIRTAAGDPDAVVRATAVAALASTAGSGGPDPSLVETLRLDPDPAVRAELAVVLAKAGRPEEAQVVVQLMLSADDPLERAAALTALARLPRVLEAPQLRSCLEDPAPIVRAAALRTWAARDEDVLDVCIEALDDPAREVRLAAAAVLRDRPDAGQPLERVILHSTERSREPTLLALEGHTDSLSVRETLLAWAEEQVARASTLRRHRVALAGADATASSVFLDQVIGRRERTIETSLLQALSILGARDASGLIRRCLHAADPEVRAQAIEALDSLGDPRLVRGVVRLLDEGVGDQGNGARDAAGAAAELTGDRDPWVRALAFRTLSELLRSQQDSIVRQAEVDPDPIVRAALGDTEEGAGMPERAQLVSQVERMMVLRRVSIFAALDPEDLQRVASLAVEQSWATDDILMEEGALGDALIVIVEGAVRVVRGQGAAGHVLRRYGEGDHIGELAVLRAAPRAATVIAEPGGVRGLVISGTAVQALLMERPEAAMAMLASLAERISQQA
jgi:HEAT repeat protein